MKPLKLLAIETSSSTGSIALGVGADIVEQSIATPREQTPRILAIIDELLAGAGLGLKDLDALVFGRGPGSFTGLRVAAAVVQGLSFAAGPPIVSISSLAALAERAAVDPASFGLGAPSRQTAGSQAGPHILCCIDARMGEVYSACFKRIDGTIVAASAECIGRPDSVTAPSSPFVAVGDGFKTYSDELETVIARAAGVDSSAVPSARELLVLAEPEVTAKRFVPVESALPVYLRESDAWRKA
jgi:tRNA threonylcarbamoyladenosine biosynthesis protein TsaB